MRIYRIGFVIAALAFASFAVAEEECLYVAAAGRTLESGAGHHWQTELEVANLGERPVHVRVELLTRGSANLDPVARELEQALAPGSSHRFDDVVRWVIEHQWRPWFGGIAVCADGPGLQAVAQVMFTQCTDSFGAGVTALGADAAIVPGAVGHVLGLREDESYRSNLDLLNLTDGPVSVTVRVVEPDGERAFFVVQELPARGQVQLYRLLATSPGPALTTARLELTSTGAVLAVASRVDRRTSDPTILPARVVSGG